MILYNTYIWFKYGKDPKPGTIIPRFYPPDNMSPAECLYLSKVGRESDMMFGSQLINLAVKGYITIDVKSAKDDKDDFIYYITENEASKIKEPLNEIEQRFFNLLFGEKGLLILTAKFNARVKISNEALVSSIDALQENKYFIRNERLKIRQFILPAIVLIAQAFAYWFFGGSMGIIFLTFVFLGIVNVLFSRWYEKPTAEGRKIMDEIAGFKMYMQYADKLRLKAVNPPTMDFTYFEKNLPYAMALGIATEWKNQFNVTTLETGYISHNYYIHGASFAHFSTFSENLSTTISSASVPPSSGGGGSGGGGFSGGGGGGGGGGGW